MKRTVFLLLTLAGGCSSTGLVRPDAVVESDAGKTCFESSAPNQGCIYCVESSCAAQLGALQPGCSDFLDCECPGGFYSVSVAPSCAAKTQEATCVGPAQSFAQCVTQSCNGECTTSSGGSGSGG